LTGGQTNGRAAEPGSSTTLTQFLKLVLARPSVELVDLGPAVGSNIAFFGERICCKIHVADLYADLDHHAGQDALDRLAEFLERRFGFPDESVDAVLGWDIFDFLDPEAATVLAGEVKRILRRGGTVLAIFSGGGSDEHGYVKYVIESEATLRRRVYQGACRRGRVLQNREINELFAGLELVSSVLLKSGAREVLFRKPVSV
jgi:hypothetical protein